VHRVAALVAVTLFFAAGAAVLLTGMQKIRDGCDTASALSHWNLTGGGHDAATARGLSRCGTLDGLSTAEVRRRLGPPDRRSDDSAAWGYETADNRTLLIAFSPDGRVSAVRLQR
jgi:hypothetical protein